MVLFINHITQDAVLFIQVTLDVRLLCSSNVDNSVLLRFQIMHFFLLEAKLFGQLCYFIFNFLERSLEAVWQQESIGRLD